METPREYYTYAYLREDGSPYYIGKGKGDRAFIKNRKGIKPPKDSSRIIFLKQNLTEEEAFKHEVYMIVVLGRKDLGTGILRNKTDGGEGCSGLIHSEETRRKLSEARKGENNPNYGKKQSEETIRKRSEANKGKNKGKTPSEKNRRKYSEAKKGKFAGENNPAYGKKWWNDGKGNTKFSKESPGPNWVPGRGKKVS